MLFRRQPQVQPRTEELTASVESNTGPFRHSISAGLTYNSDDENWIEQPLNLTERFSFFDSSFMQDQFAYDFDEDQFTNRSELFLSLFEENLTFRDSFTFAYDSEDSTVEATDNTATLKLWWFTFQLQAKQSYEYEFDETSGWLPGSEETFQVTNFSAKANYTLGERKFWRNRIELKSDISGTWDINFLRVTDSVMNFNLSFALTIKDFLELTFSSRSENRSSYRYIPSLAEKLGQTWLNPIVDIARSFNFFDEQDRITSFFNLDVLSIKATHFMKDWDLNLEYEGSPELVEEDGVSSYDWVSNFSVFVQWKPIPEIKRNISVENDELVF